MTYQDSDYYRRRERQERGAAKRATNAAARAVHQQMAERYAAILLGFALTDPVHSLRSCGAL